MSRREVATALNIKYGKTGPPNERRWSWRWSKQLFRLECRRSWQSYYATFKHLSSIYTRLHGRLRALIRPVTTSLVRTLANTFWVSREATSTIAMTAATYLSSILSQNILQDVFNCDRHWGGRMAHLEPNMIATLPSICTAEKRRRLVCLYRVFIAPP